jgi:rhodanese-related sulfurtransferase
MNGFWTKGQARRALAAWAFLALQYSTIVAAQVAPGGTMPEALKTIAQASGVCHKDDAPVGGPVMAPAPWPDMSCAITAHALHTLLQRQSTVLIDVRQSADYEAFHIDGSLNVSFSDLRSKPYWRNKTAVLVGSGRAERELYGECARLKQLGYKEVLVLQGGITTWLASGQTVTGRAPSARSAAGLSAAQFWLESQNPDNLVALGAGLASLQKAIPFSVVLPQITATTVRKVIERRRKEQKNAPLAAVVLAPGAAMSVQQIELLQRSMLPIPVLVYYDGAAAFSNHRNLQDAVWLAQAHGPKQPACGQ